MNAKKLIAAVAVFAAAGSAFAANPEYVDFTGFQGTKSRDEVKAELQQAKESGTYASNGEFYRGQQFADVQTTNQDSNSAIARTHKAAKSTSTN